MTPEVKAAIERLKEQRDSPGEAVLRDPSYHWSLGSHGTRWIDDLMLIRDAFIAQHTQQPVDWPTEPGWWWMKFSNDAEPVIVDMVTKHPDRVRHDCGYYLKRDCQRSGARFLPAHIPTFPPREAE